MNRVERRRPGLPPGWMVPAVAMLSAAALAYELLLLRFFSVMYWHHFAHLVISMALLGAGASGAVLSLTQGRLLPVYRGVFFASAALFSLSIPLSVTLAGGLPFYPQELIWDGRQLARMAVVFLPSALPFFFSGTCIGLAMRRSSAAVGRIYRADLVGAALGALALTLLLFLCRLETALRLIAMTGLLAGLLIGGRRPVIRFAVAALVSLCVMGWPSGKLVPTPSPFKDLSRMLLVPDVEIAAERLSPVGIFSALTPGRLPFRHAPGLSMLSPVGPPSQVALLHDGHLSSMIQETSAENPSLDFMRWTPMALPYVLAPSPNKVLIAGSGGGGDVLHALQEGAASVVAVEPYREWVELVNASFDGFSGSVYRDERVQVIHSDVRGFLASSAPVYDLIQISPLGTAVLPAAGSGQALSVQFLYTLEGMRQALSSLAPEGALSISFALELPPRAMVKLLSTLKEAMLLQGFERPQDHVAVIRAWNTMTVFCQRPPLTEDQQQALRDFCRTRAFDPVWFPAIEDRDINRVNVLDQPLFHEEARRVWAGEEPGDSRFYLNVPTDDHPWFGRTFRWDALPLLWRQRGSGSAGMLEWETLLLWAALLFAVFVSLAFIGLPLTIRHLRLRRLPGGRDWRLAPLVYFAVLGLSFLFLEIAFLHRFVLFLRHPMISMAVIVPSFLLFAGLGSGCAEAFSRRLSERCPDLIRDRPVAMAAVAIMIFSLLYLHFLPLIFALGAGWSVVIRIAISVLLISGPAFWMGMPFPLGIRRLGTHNPAMVPLAWGVNGFFSVISATGATVLALHGGFRLVILMAVGLYLLAAALERRC